MSKTKQHECTPQACTYDHEVEAKGWRGPEVVFGLAYDLITTGDKLLDIGIGTGLGSRPFHKAGLRVFGMDISPEMLAACRAKKFAEDLRQHDLLNAPYPFASDSMDHAISVGVLNHFRDLDVVFAETARILREGGAFAFMVLDRPPEASSEFVLNLGHIHPGKTVTLYRHGREELDSLLGSAFTILKSVEFTVYLTRGWDHAVSAMAYVARRDKRA